MRPLRAVAVSAVLAILGAGCSSTPPARFYTLSSTSTPAAASSELSVAVGPVAVPAAVDRPQIVVSLGPNRVWLDEFNRWAAPLQDDIARVVAKNLAGDKAISAAQRGGQGGDPATGPAGGGAVRRQSSSLGAPPSPARSSLRPTS